MSPSEMDGDGGSSASSEAWALVGQERLAVCLAMSASVGRTVAGTSRQRLELVDAAIARAVGDVLPVREHEMAALVLALCDDRVRDACMVQADLAHTLAAQRLWTALVVGTPQPYRALPASMLTCTAYLLGDAQLARDSIGYALDVDPEDRLVLSSAPEGLVMPPDALRRAAEQTAAFARAHIQQGSTGA